MRQRRYREHGVPPLFEAAGMDPPLDRNPAPTAAERYAVKQEPTIMDWLAEAPPVPAKEQQR